MAKIKLPSSQSIYTMFERFVQAALVNDDSLFAPGSAIWSLETLNKLYADFVEQPDISDQSFLNKFNIQLGAADDHTILLAAELLYMHLLPLNGIKADTKRAQVRTVLSWAHKPLTTSIPDELDRALELGIAQAGVAMMTGKPFQIGFLLEALRQWKQLPQAERQQALRDPWAFRTFLFGMPIKFAYAQREMLLHIVHPETFEPMMAQDHKQAIAKRFADLIDDQSGNVDQRILQIRAKLEPHYGQQFNFYTPSIHELWFDDPDPNLDDDPTPEELEKTPVEPAPLATADMAAIQEWQSSFQSDNPLSRQIANEYPQWLKQAFGDHITMRIGNNRGLYIYVDTKLRQQVWLNAGHVYVLLHPGITWDFQKLRAQISRPHSILNIKQGTRFFLLNQQDYALLQQLTRAVIQPTPTAALAHSLGTQLGPYIELARHLGNRIYTAQEIVDQLGRISPPIVQLTAAPDAEQLATDLQLLRLIQHHGDGRYQRWEHLSDGTSEHMLRYAALTMFVKEEQHYRLPALDAPFDGLPKPGAAWPLQGAILPWYEEAGLVQRSADGSWQASPQALEPLDAQTPTARTFNTFLEYLQQARQSPRALPAPEHKALWQLDPVTLEQRIIEIQKQLLVERSTILRIYRSLIAGQHVILSGPPGTGKTHLARILPLILWRDPTETIVITMVNDPNTSPATQPQAEALQRKGYLVEVVTATEDWGVRHVVGGIAPQLQQQEVGKTLVYTIQHGHLTRTVLRNYQGYTGENIPVLDPPQRAELSEDEQSYRGIWLVIDEFTRAQVDAAFGSLLTTLGGQKPMLAIPVENGAERSIPLPPDFRLIGTLNSFDRHFLNQMSEAMKRRFAFIDMLPPSRDHAQAEQGLAVYNALTRLHSYGVRGISAAQSLGSAEISGVLSVRCIETPDESMLPLRYQLSDVQAEAQAALRSFWQLFTSIRLYRQLGTAQAEAVYTALFSGYSIGMPWSMALDSALADTLADQLQVLARDEQRVLLKLLEHSADAAKLSAAINEILKQLPGPRQSAHLSQLKASESQQRASIDEMKPDSLHAEQTSYLFNIDPEQLSIIPSNGLFAQRLRAFINERGL